jgi:hypothetical protein
VRCGWECRSCGAFTEREEILVELVEVCLRVRYKNEERKDNCEAKSTTSQKYVQGSNI